MADGDDSNIVSTAAACGQVFKTAPPPLDLPSPHLSLSCEDVPKGCEHIYGDSVMLAWLPKSELSSDCVLLLHDLDAYEAHAAVQHLSELPCSPHTVYVAMPIAQRSDPAFRPWLRSGVTVNAAAQVHVVSRGQPCPYQYETRCEQSVVLAFAGTNQRIHTSPHKHEHAASFPIRVGGKAVHALFDSGATCSIMQQSFARALGLPLHPCIDTPVHGIGGQVSVVGRVRAPVRIGASHTEHEFVVLSQSISGYEVLIGQDFMIFAHCTIAYDSTACMLDIGDPKHEGKRLARLRRPLS